VEEKKKATFGPLCFEKNISGGNQEQRISFTENAEKENQLFK